MPEDLPHGRLRDVFGDVWCNTCEHSHIPDIPTVTFRCGWRCGFGVWDLALAVHHAEEYPDHLVMAVHHETVSIEQHLSELWAACEL